MTTSGPFEFAKYRAPQFGGPNYKLSRDRAADSDNGEPAVENLSDLLGRVSKNSTGEINSLIRHEIEEYNALSQQVMQLTKIISESVEKFPTVRASVDR